MATCQRSDQGQNAARPRIQANSIDNTKAPMSRPSEVLPRRLNEGDQAMEAVAAAQRTQAQEDHERPWITSCDHSSFAPEKSDRPRSERLENPALHFQLEEC